ncbi:sulfotransferase [Mucilaginibacter sp. McL0603]|uniref:sulfotransferase n=1 Tax=Mucilaginibacter sp. McL0603 TaxID=3415670 RepID=UPI003CF7A96C
MQSKTLMVVGMHRSGTSLITNWLHRCGLQIGEHLLEPGKGNVEGHFEDVQFLRIHEEILISNDFPSSGYVYDKKIDISIYHLERLKSVIKVKNQLYKQWGWKEPRTCLFLDLYRELLPDSKYLVIMRDHGSVVHSMLKRDFALFENKYLSRKLFQRLVWLYFRRGNRRKKFYQNNAECYLKIWIEYNEHILNMLEDLPVKDYIVINYSLLGKHDKKVFSALTKTWQFALNYFPFKEVYNKSLISKPVDISPFIHDSALLVKAKNIEQEFEKYIRDY